jgi:clan AA aspartic protease (TIGR02281 family)
MKELTLGLMLASTAFATPAMANTYVELECTVTAVSDKATYLDSKALIKAAHSINKPESRVIRIDFDDKPMPHSVTYGLGQGRPQNWSMAVTKSTHKVLGDEADSITAETSVSDQWGHDRWIYVGGSEASNLRFLTAIAYPDKQTSLAMGICKDTMDASAKSAAPLTQELRDPGATPQASNSFAVVPIHRTRDGYYVQGFLNETTPMKMVLDTGATISGIPYDLAAKMGLRAIGERPFQLANGSITKAQIVLLKKLTIGETTVENIEAAVSASGSEPLLGKNVLERFTSYEINHQTNQLVLKR